MEDLCDQIKQMELMMTRLEKKTVPPRFLREHYRWNKNRTGNHANQHNGRPSERLQCTYCGKYGHTEASCYTKQADEIAK